jgi:hypothetical protein
MRLGNQRGGAEDIRQQPWFHDFDFDGMLARRLPAPWVPRIRSPTDASNFDPVQEPEPQDVDSYVPKGAWDKDF